MPKKRLAGSIGFILVLGITAKLFIDTNTQMFNPFLLVIATGIGTSAVAMGRIVAIRNLTGLAAPLFGALADRIGYKIVIRASLLTAGAGMILVALSDNLFFFTLALILSGLGGASFIPNLHAYLSSKLPYEKRARGLGMIEYSWALAGIIGLFISGYLIESWSWRMPFYIIGGALVLMSLVYGFLPSDERVVKKALTAQPKSKGRFFDLGEHAGSAWGCILLSGCIMFGMMHIMIIHGGWLQAEYGLTPSRLGTVALLFGFFDLTASITVSLAVDRIGKRKSVLIGVVGMVLGLALLPVLNRGLVPAIIGLAIPRGFFEFAIVSNFPLLSEQAPQHRGKVLSLSITVGLIGTTMAGLTGPPAYLRFGIAGLWPVSLAASLAALALVLFVIREQPYRNNPAIIRER